MSLLKDPEINKDTLDKKIEDHMNHPENQSHIALIYKSIQAYWLFIGGYQAMVALLFNTISLGQPNYY